MYGIVTLVTITLYRLQTADSHDYVLDTTTSGNMNECHSSRRDQRHATAQTESHLTAVYQDILHIDA